MCFLKYAVLVLDVLIVLGKVAFKARSEEAETTLFRVVQEGLTNVHRHSKSPTARIRLLRHPTEVKLEISDKGQRMPAKTLRLGVANGRELGVGILGMRERARQFGVDWKSLQAAEAPSSEW